MPGCELHTITLDQQTQFPKARRHLHRPTSRFLRNQNKRHVLLVTGGAHEIARDVRAQKRRSVIIKQHRFHQIHTVFLWRGHDLDLPAQCSHRFGCLQGLVVGAAAVIIVGRGQSPEGREREPDHGAVDGQNDQKRTNEQGWYPAITFFEPCNRCHDPSPRRTVSWRAISPVF